MPLWRFQGTWFPSSSRLSRSGKLRSFWVAFPACRRSRHSRSQLELGLLMIKALLAIHTRLLGLGNIAKYMTAFSCLNLYGGYVVLLKPCLCETF